MFLMTYILVGALDFMENIIKFPCIINKNTLILTFEDKKQFKLDNMHIIKTIINGILEE